MFERYTEKARRVIFFARYEASQYGSPYIETEHLLLGIMREDRALVKQFLGQSNAESEIRAEIEKHIPPRERISTSVEVPLTSDSIKVLHFAAEEAERLAQRYVVRRSDLAREGPQAGNDSGATGKRFRSYCQSTA